MGIVAVTTFTSDTETVTRTKLNGLAANLVTEFNGNITNTNIDASAAIAASKLNLAALSNNITFTGTLDFSGATITAGFTVADLTATTIDINGGTIGGITIDGNWTAASQTCADLGTVTTANIDGGTLDGVNIGTTTATGELIVNNSSDAADGLGDQGSDGEVLTSAGAGVNPTWSAPSGAWDSMEVFTSTGTWTKPAGVSKVFVKVIGGGGAGASSSNDAAAGGGGAGGYSEGFVTVTGNVTVTVGGAGGTSSFAGSTTPQGTGGAAGSSYNGGDGGTGSAGTLNIDGGDGGSIYQTGTGNATGASGGTSFFGGGGKGVSGHAGQAGQAYGSGGGGGADGDAGGAGKGGVVIVYWTA